MTETALLQEGVAIFGIALLVGWVFRRLKAPTILGFLFAGLLIGPNTLGWISEEGVARFAELGLVLLLFSIGIELSAATMFRTGSRILLSSIGQVVGTVLLAFPVFWAIGFAPGAALVLGAAVAPSSSPIALKQLSDRGEAGTSIGGVLTGMQLLQDMCVILFMVFLPLFAQGDGSRPTMSIYAIPALVLFGALLPVGRVVLPRIIDVFVRFGGRELLALFAVLMALGGAWLASLTGWPVALGACIAGLVLASADVRHQVLAEITPLRDIFNALFFVSMGMLVDTTLFITHLHWFCLAVAATVLLKPAVAAISVVATGWPSRVGIHVGIGLCTVSEVGYVLAHEAMRLGLISGEWLDVFTTYIVGTMMVGAAAFPAAGTISRVLSARIRRAAEGTEPSDTRADEAPQGHVILVGCGQNGETLARVLKSTRIPFLLIDINPSRIRQAQTDHMPGLVGDATRMSILEHAGLAEARALVVAINDPESTRRIVAQARSRRADLYIIARTRAVQEIDRLTTLGANLVEKTITEDRTTRSVEHIFSLEAEEMEHFIRTIRDV
ncbi:MAG TPA: cation:proton antiporter, partial [Candidatus Hydrogenedentes bacterium]|nr:cation:proton antiporter [Candidatus Hydrogenedentota bacterium]